MQKRLDTIAEHATNVDAFQQALSHITSATAKRATQPGVEPRPSLPRRGTSGSKPAFPPVKLKPAATLQLPPILQEALRNAGASFQEDSIETLKQSLTTLRLERDGKLKDHFAATSSSTHSTLAARLEKAYGDQSAILDALYLHTPYSQVHLTNSKLDEGMKKTDRELEIAERSLLRSEADELNLSDPKVRAFIGKYGS